MVKRDFRDLEDMDKYRFDKGKNLKGQIEDWEDMDGRHWTGFIYRICLTVLDVRRERV